ncbi:hypothetical protein RJ639_021594 [Escallonia herrerae]|uniref:Uncharacterized protein n=1 Tax=Escallonia herrerae TaxID=1293975 RepID=A0AA88V991_9ASTE|nr:hypothetical protein RJ639_021594 [Escallonia herrerae]
MYGTSPCVTLLVLTCIALAFVAAITYSSKGLSSLFSLPSSPWAWTTSIGTSSSSLSISSFDNGFVPDIRCNPHLSLISEKMNRAVSNLVKDLNAESVLRRGKERDEKLERTEAGLARARAFIRDATIDQSICNTVIPLRALAPSLDTNGIIHSSWLSLPTIIIITLQYGLSAVLNFFMKSIPSTTPNSSMSMMLKSFFPVHLQILKSTFLMTPLCGQYLPQCGPAPYKHPPLALHEPCSHEIHPACDFLHASYPLCDGGDVPRPHSAHHRLPWASHSSTYRVPHLWHARALEISASHIA